MVWDNQGHVSAWSATDSLQTELLDWKGAAWIAYAKLPDTSLLTPGGKGLKKGERVPNDVLPLFRKTFILKGPVKKATAFVCGLGQFELSVNGEKAGDHFLDPVGRALIKRPICAPRYNPSFASREKCIGYSPGQRLFCIRLRSAITN
jgi:alpha-L-rhamnosidase